MKILHFADLHLEAPFRWAEPAVGRVLRRELRDALEAICATAVEEGADALSCGGDLYEQEYFTPDTVSFVQRCFSSVAPIKVLLAPGNHDWLGRASLYSQARFGPNVVLFGGDGLEPFDLEDGLTVWGAAHHAPAGTPGFLSGFRAGRAGVNLALFHGSEEGDFAFQGETKAKHAPFAASDVRACGLDHALVGHFHRPRDADTHTYPGNPSALGFGEDGERGAVLVEVSEDGSISRRRVSVAASRFSDARLDITGAADSQEILARAREVLGGLEGLVRLEIGGELAPGAELAAGEIEALGAQLDRLDALLVKMGDVRVGYDLERVQAEPTVRGRFVRAVLARTDLDEERRRKVLLSGLRALDGRRDLDVI